MTAETQTSGNRGFGERQGKAAYRDAAFVSFALLVCYVLTATRTIQGGDTAEFTLVALRGGVPHPPGYPLHVVLSRLFAALPLGSPPFRVAMLSAVAAVAAAALLANLITRLTGDRLAGVATGLCFGLAPITWKLAGVPEVFTLNALVVAGTMWVVLRLRSVLATGTPRLPIGHITAAFALVGLGLSNHHTAIAAVPFAVWALVMAARGAGARNVALLTGAAMGATALGLLPYLYLPLSAAAAGAEGWAWGDPRTFGGLAEHFLRSHYGTLSLGLYEHAARPLANLDAFWGALPAQLVYVYFAAGIVGAVAMARRDRPLGIVLGASLLASGVLLLAVFNLPPGDLGHAVAERFHLLPLVFFSVLVGAGLAAIGRRLSSRLVRIAIVLPLPVMGLVGVRPAAWRMEPTVERALEAALRPVAPEAVILGIGDMESFGFSYLIHGRRLREDVRYLDMHLLRTPWYHARARRLVPDIGVPFDPERTAIKPLVAQLSEELPVYLTPSLAAEAGGVPFYPEGLLLRVAPPGRPPPPPDRLEASVDRATRDLGMLPDQPLDAWSRYARGRAADVWAILAGAYARAGRSTDAARCRARATALVGVAVR